jgi:hypothetical protein
MTFATRRTSRLSGCLLPLLVGVAAAIHPAAGAIRVEVLRGDGANNNAILGAATSPMVRITDGNGNPVRDALVVFSAPESGASVDFGGSGPSAHGLTGDTGVVGAPPARPVAGDGPLEIRVVASQSGQFANAIVHQMNLGVNGNAGRAQELDVVAVRREAQAGTAPARSVDFAVRVEDGEGRPVPWAKVLLVLRRKGVGGKIEELDSQQGPSDETGQMAGQFTKLSVSGRLEFMVRAESDGRRATRYFPVQ